MFTLRLRNFWPGASSPTGFFAHLLRTAIQDEIRIVTRNEPADLEIVAATASTKSQILGRLRARIARPERDHRWADHETVRPQLRRSIWFTAENVRPPATDSWSGFLSFDLDPLGGRNVYMPLWLVDLRDFNADGQTTVEDLISTRIPDPRRPAFACAFIGNPEPMRFHAIRALRSLGEVHVFGKSVGRPVRDKYAVARGYRYVLCFENDLYPGYVTEKALDGARSGCIPIYRGLDTAKFLNPSAMINCAQDLDFRSMTSQIEELESDEARRATVLGRPILNRRPTLDLAVSMIRAVMDG